MIDTKRCSGYKGHWECSEDYPDHKVPFLNFGLHAGQPDGLQGICQKCMNHRDGIRNGIIGEAIKIAGTRDILRSMPKEDRAKVMEMAKKTHPSNVIPFKAKPKPTVTLKSTVRNDGLPKGIVTPSEKKVRREAKRIQYTPEGWIYALKDHMKEPGFLKLGKTNDLKRRLADFNTAGDFEMMHWAKVVDAKAAEDMLHSHFIDSHHLREWFKVDLKDAVEAMDSIADTVNDPDWDGIVDVGDADDA